MFINTGISFINTSLLYKIYYNKKNKEIDYFYIDGKITKVFSEDTESELDDIFQSYKETISNYIVIEDYNILLNINEIEEVYISNIEKSRLEILFNNSYIEKIKFQSPEDCQEEYSNIVNELTEAHSSDGEYITSDTLYKELQKFSNEFGNTLGEYIDKKIESSMDENIDDKITSATNSKFIEVDSRIDFLTGEIDNLNGKVFGEPV